MGINYRFYIMNLSGGKYHASIFLLCTRTRTIHTPRRVGTFSNLISSCGKNMYVDYYTKIVGRRLSLRSRPVPTLDISINVVVSSAAELLPPIVQVAAPMLRDWPPCPQTSTSLYRGTMPIHYEAGRHVGQNGWQLNPKTPGRK